MANAKKCDRCGNFYDFYKGIEFTPSGNRYASVTLEGYKSKIFDLCPDCMQKLIYFLQTDSGYAYNMFFPCTNCKHRMLTINDTPCVSCKRINNGPEYDTDYFEYDEKKEGE